MDIRRNNDGWIEVICGSMFAGKTEELIRRANRLDYAKKKYLVFKPTIDDRYSATEIVSHSNYRKNSKYRKKEESCPCSIFQLFR